MENTKEKKKKEKKVSYKKLHKYDYIDNNYLVVGGPVITEAGDKFAASNNTATRWSSYLKYSSAVANGLYYTDANLALSKAKAGDTVTIYISELDMTDSTYAGTIAITDTLTVTFADGTTPAWTVIASNGGNVEFTDSVADGIVTRTYAIN